MLWYHRSMIDNIISLSHIIYDIMDWNYNILVQNLWYQYVLISDIMVNIIRKIIHDVMELKPWYHSSESTYDIRTYWYYRFLWIKCYDFMCHILTYWYHSRFCMICIWYRRQYHKKTAQERLESLIAYMIIMILSKNYDIIYNIIVFYMIFNVISYMILASKLRYHVWYLIIYDIIYDIIHEIYLKSYMI
jgi:hypothetical protein